MKTILYIVSYFMVIALFSACNNNNIVSFEADFGEIEELIWQNPDSAIQILGKKNADELSIGDKMRYNLLYELASSRTYNNISQNQILPDIIDYFASNNENELLARAYYTLGYEQFLQNDYFNAMLTFKKAENYINYLPDNLPYKCLIPLAEGRIAETEYLLHISYIYYIQALDHAIVLGDKYRIACIYNDIARTRCEINDSIALIYYEKAIEITKEIKDTLLYYDILIQKELHNPNIDSTSIYNYAKILMDEYCHPLYAHIITEYLQDRGNISDAQKYLDICETDTFESNWNKEHFYYLQSRQNALKGNTRLAFEQLDRLYQNQTEQIFKNGKTKTYTISRMYDLEQEKNKTLQLSIEKQRLWITIAIIIFIFIIAVTSATYILHLQKQRHKAQQQANEIDKLKAQAAEEAANKEIDRLNMELEIKRVQLRDSLRERIQLSKDIAQATEETTKEFPKWLQAWIQKNTFTQGENIDRLLIEFKSVYGNLLTQLKKKHPGLTDKDLQYIALSILDLDVNDVCHILGTTERTIWNRRQSVKNRLGNPKMDYEEWILQLRKVPNF